MIDQEYFSNRWRSCQTDLSRVAHISDGITGLKVDLEYLAIALMSGDKCSDENAADVAEGMTDLIDALGTVMRCLADFETDLATRVET